MGIYDRDYIRRDDNRYGSGFGGGPQLSSRLRGRSIVFWIIAANVAVFIIDNLMRARDLPVGPLTIWGHFSAETFIDHWQIWRVLTFQFLHVGTFHLLFNMLAIYFFGPMVESYLGSRRFIAFYLLSGIAGAIMYLLLWRTGILHYTANTPLVGASAGVFGILIGGAHIAPNTTVMLVIPPIPMKLKTMAYVFVGIAVFQILSAGRNAGGEAGHLGGALLGWLLIRRPNLLNFAEGLKRKPRLRY